jgi:hypothetical protein
MADGAAQKARDEALKRAATGGKSPDRWGDKETQRRLYGLDVVKQADQEYARLWTSSPLLSPPLEILQVSVFPYRFSTNRLLSGN